MHILIFKSIFYFLNGHVSKKYINKLTCPSSLFIFLGSGSGDLGLYFSPAPGDIELLCKKKRTKF